MKWIYFLKKRLDKDSPYGLTLTIGILLCAYFFSHFISTLYQIYTASRFVAAEPQIIALLQAYIPRSFHSFFLVLTLLANIKVLLVVGVISILIFIAHRKPIETAYFLLSTGLGIFSSITLKYLIDRERPNFAHLIAIPLSGSFPSGHALFAICFYGFLLYLLFRTLHGLVFKFFIVVLALFLVIGIGFSRVYLGVHFPTDVFAGWYLGLVVLTVSVTLYEMHQRIQMLPSQPSRGKKTVTLLIMVFGVIAFIATLASEYRTMTARAEAGLQEITLDQFISSESLYSQDFYGKRMEPFSFLVVGTEEELVGVFAAAGWKRAENPTIANFIKLSTAVAQNSSYPTAPVTPAFYNGSVHAIAFEEETEEKTARKRHHARYWKTRFSVGGKQVWVGTASKDIDVVISSFITLPTHTIDPAIDTEREYISGQLGSTGLIVQQKKIDLVGSVTGINASGSNFHTDGWAYVFQL